MLTKTLVAALLTCVSALSLPQDAEPAAEAVRAGDYAIDSGHSAALFRVTHLDVGAFWGRFNAVEGAVAFDPEDLSACSVSVVIPVQSVDSNDGQRDEHLKSPDFFNAKEFPEISFKSTKVAAGKDGALAVTGDFTMLGETRSLVLEVQPVGHGERGRFGYRAGWETEFTISRSEYGMEFMTGALGDEVRIIISLETVLR